MINSQIHLLHALCIFAESRTLAKAAQKIGVSQPMLSVYLKQLESEMPQKLFQTVGRKKELTNYGKKLAAALKPRFDGLPEIISSLALEFQREDQARLKIAGNRSVLRRIALDAEYKGTLELLQGTSEEALDWLTQGKADLAMSIHLPNRHDIIAKRAFSDEFALVYPKKWNIPNDTLSKATLKYFLSRPYLAYSEGAPFDRFLDSLAFENSPKPTQIIEDWPLLFELLRLGKGWAIAPDSYVEPDDPMSILRLPKQMRLMTEFYILTRKSDAQIPWLGSFVKSVQATFQNKK